MAVATFSKGNRRISRTSIVRYIELPIKIGHLSAVSPLHSPVDERSLAKCAKLGNLAGNFDKLGGILLRALDIFSGAGGSSAGARMAGVEMAGAIDMCPIATETYRANFPGTHVLTDRLERVDLSKLRRQVGEIDLLMASPECTNHTCAKGSTPRDESSRATAMQVIAYARSFRPRWLVMENVIHMRPWSRYREMCEAFKDIGYNIAEQVLDASDYGVAQRRRRLFIVGDREKIPGTAIGKRRGRRRTANSILDAPGAWKTSKLCVERRAEGTLERARRGLEALGDDASFLLVYYGSDGSGGWQPLDRPLRTITTIDRFALVAPGADGPTMRMLQVPELKRAMGFEEEFTLPVGARRDRIRLLGNPKNHGILSPPPSAPKEPATLSKSGKRRRNSSTSGRCA